MRKEPSATQKSLGYRIYIRFIKDWQKYPGGRVVKAGTETYTSQASAEQLVKLGVAQVVPTWIDEEE